MINKSLPTGDERKPFVPSRPRSPWFNPTPRPRPRTAGFPRQQEGRPIHQMWQHRQQTTKVGLPIRPSTANIGKKRDPSMVMKEGEYVFTNPNLILRTMQDRQQNKKGYDTLRLYRDPQLAGKKSHICEVTKASIKHGIEKQGFKISENVAEQVFSKLAGKNKTKLSGGEFLEKLRDSGQEQTRFFSSNPAFTSRTTYGKKNGTTAVANEVPFVDQVRSIRVTTVPDYKSAMNKVKGFSAGQVQKYKHIARNRARDNFTAQQYDIYKQQKSDLLRKRLQISHRGQLGGAKNRGEWKPPLSVRKHSPRTALVIRDKNDTRSGRSSIMTHMFHSSGWEISHGHSSDITRGHVLKR